MLPLYSNITYLKENFANPNKILYFGYGAIFNIINYIDFITAFAIITYVLFAAETPIGFPRAENPQRENRQS